MSVLLSWVVSVALSMKFKRGVEQFATLSIAFLVFPVFALGLFNHIAIGIWISLLCGAISFGGIACYIIKDKESAIKVLLSVGSLSYLFFILALGYLSMDRGFGAADEFAYWGIVLKYYCAGGKIPYTDAIHPATGVLWAYLAEKTWIGYAESMAIWSMAVLAVSFFMPLYRFVNGKDKLIKCITMGLVIVLALFTIDAASLSTIMQDTVLGCAFAYTLCSIYEYMNEKDKFFLIKVVMGLCFMSTFKRSGIIFTGLILLFLSFMSIQKKYPFLDKGRDIALFLSMATICPLTLFFLWGCGAKYIIPVMALVVIGIVAALVANKEYKRIKHNLGFGIGMFFLLFWSALVVLHRQIIISDDFYKATVINFFNGLCSADTQFGGNAVKLSVLLALVFFGCFSVVYMYFCKQNEDDINGKNFLLCGGAAEVTIFIYLLVLLWKYLDSIAKSNGSQYVPSLDRYVGGCIYYPLIFLVIYAFLYIKKSNGINRIHSLSLAMVFVFSLLITDMSSVNEYFLDKKSEPKFYGFSSIGIELKETDKVFFVYEKRGSEDTDYGNAFMYEMYPVECNVMNEFHFSVLNEIDNTYMRPEDFVQMLSDEGYTYVYMQSVDENFATVYGGVVEDADTIKSGDVYVPSETQRGVILKKASRN